MQTALLTAAGDNEAVPLTAAVGTEAVRLTAAVGNVVTLLADEGYGFPGSGNKGCEFVTGQVHRLFLFLI